jgi:hypothetical protein
MGTVLAMRLGTFGPALAGLLLLAACGNDSNTGLLGGLPVKALAQAALAQAGIGKPAAPPAAPAAPDPAAVAAARKALEDAGTPLYIIQAKALGFATYFGKLGQNGDVVTWSTKDFTTVALRDGMVVATRGFGPDILSAEAPTTAQIRTGTGTTHRRYVYLDAADQRVELDYDCTLSVVGTETITLVGKDYRVRRVDESCTGEHGSFVNSFWFDKEAKLRQSSQLLAPGIANLLLQRIID